MKRGDWQIGMGRSVLFKRLGIYGYGRIGRSSGYGKAFGMEVQVWGRDGSLERGSSRRCRRGGEQRLILRDE